MDLGSHTVDLVCMTELRKNEMQRQAIDSKEALEALLSRSITMFSYPSSAVGRFLPHIESGTVPDRLRGRSNHSLGYQPSSRRYSAILQEYSYEIEMRRTPCARSWRGTTTGSAQRSGLGMHFVSRKPSSEKRFADVLLSVCGRTLALRERRRAHYRVFQRQDYAGPACHIGHTQRKHLKSRRR